MFDLSQHKIKVHEPFSEFLMGSETEYKFEITLLDVVRFSGHACPSIVGTFFISQQVIKYFFKDELCRRGEIAISHSQTEKTVATGPMSLAFGFIFGAWGDAGFGGLSKGMFARRGLQTFGALNLRQSEILFEHLPTGKKIVVTYDTSSARDNLPAEEVFPKTWRYLIEEVAKHPESVIKVKEWQDDR